MNKKTLGILLLISILVSFVLLFLLVGQVAITEKYCLITNSLTEISNSQSKLLHDKDNSFPVSNFEKINCPLNGYETITSQNKFPGGENE